MVFAQGKHLVKTKAESRGGGSNEGGRQPASCERRRTRSSLVVPEGASPRWHLDLGLLAAIPVRHDTFPSFVLRGSWGFVTAALAT